jgi:hypothetical protein
MFMLGSNAIGQVIGIQGDNSVLIVRALAGEQIVAKEGELIAKGDIVIVTGTGHVLIDINYSGIEGVGIISDGEMAKLDDALLDRIAPIIASSSVDDPVNIGVEPTLDIIQLFNQASPSAGVDTSGIELSQVNSESLFLFERTNEELLPESGFVTTFTSENTEEKSLVGEEAPLVLINTVDDIVAQAPIIEDIAAKAEPGSTGLLSAFYDTAGLAALTDNTAADIEGSGLLGASSSVNTRLAAGFGEDTVNLLSNPESQSLGMGGDDLYAVTGLIYLAAGHEYEFSGIRDDALHIEMGGQVMVTTVGNSYGNFNSGINDAASAAATYTISTFSAPADGYYTLEAYVGNTFGSGNIALSLSDNGVIQTLSTENYQLYTGLEDLLAVGARFDEFESNVTGSAAAEHFTSTGITGAVTTLATSTDGGYFPVFPTADVVGTLASIDLSGLSVSVKGADTLTELLLGIPIGAVLSDGSNNYTATLAATSVNVVSWNLDTLTVNLSAVSPPPAASSTVDITVDATATSTTFDTANTNGTFTLGILPDSYNEDSSNGGNAVDATISGSIVDGDDDLVLGSSADDTLTAGTQGGVVLQGFAGDDTITGGDNDLLDDTKNGNNSILGGSGDDTLTGGSGEDVMLAGTGSDILRGGFAGGGAETDTDTFVWQSGDQGAGLNGANLETDTILDFVDTTADSGGDILNLAGLLTNETSANIGNYISLSESGGNTSLAIDVDGDGSGTDFTVQLDGVTGTDLSTLIDNGNLVFDTPDVNVLRGNELINNGRIDGTTADEMIYLNGGEMVGGGGNDTYIYGDIAGNSLTRIRDFTTGDTSTNTDADTIDLSDVLVGANAGNIGDYINIELNNFGFQDDIEVYFNGLAPDGAAGSPDLVIRFQNSSSQLEDVPDPDISVGVSAAVYAGTLDEAAILQQLLTDGNLVIS